MYKDLQLPSDFLIDNHKSLSKRRDFEDLCESLDDLQHEAMDKAFHAVFKFYAKSNSLSYWEHSVGSANAKEDILALIERVESQTKELL